MTKLAGVLWDMDGTLVDTSELHFHSWVETLPRYGISCTQELFDQIFGLGLEDSLKAIFGDMYSVDLLQTVGWEKENSFRQALRGNISLLPGVMKLLGGFRDADTPQAVASSAPPENVDAVLDELKIRAYYQTVVSAKDLPGKPDPRIFLAAAQGLQVSPQECIVIEDSVHGVEAAIRAGMKCIAVTTTNSAENLAMADRVVARLDKLDLDDFEAVITGDCRARIRRRR